MGHLKDRGFCLPIVNEAEAVAQKKRQELEQEIEKVKKEYEDKQKRKAEKRNEKKKEQKGKDPKAKKEEGENEDAEDAKDEKEKEDKIIELSKSEPKTDDDPRIYALQKYVGCFFVKNSSKLFWF
ncbi:MAG: hypothetical protein Q9165_000749 [Trypethelium subeluteriae]